MSTEDLPFPVPLAEFRGFFYRRAQSRRLHVASKIVKHSGRLYLEARSQHFYEDPPIWGRARRVPPMHLTGAARQIDDGLLTVAEGVILLLKAQGYQVIPPNLDPVREETEAEPDYEFTEAGIRERNLERIRQLPLPDGWAWSQFQPGQMLPPGVPDIKGAVYDSTDRHEIAALALEFQEMAAKCTCGADDLRFHQPSCAVTGG
jgi:hypothetical protein